MLESRKKFETLAEIEERLSKIMLQLESKQRTNPEHVFFDNQEFIQVMNISKRCAQKWRDEGVIGYSQIGGKIYYRLSDILNLLDKCYKPSKF
jgi:hypothetical protein